MAHLILTKFHEQEFEEFKFEQEKMMKQLRTFQSVKKFKILIFDHFFDFDKLKSQEDLRSQKV